MNYSCAGPIENNCTIFISICKHKTLKPTNLLVLVTKTSRHTFSPCITFRTNIIMKVTAFLEQKLIKCKTTLITIHVVSHSIKVLCFMFTSVMTTLPKNTTLMVNCLTVLCVLKKLIYWKYIQ